MSMSETDWTKVMNVNLNGAFNMSKLALFEMMQNRFGRIINISSISSKLNMVGQANYSASKAAMNSFAKTMAKEVAKKGITVNTICPGFIETKMLSDMPQEQLKEYKKTVPMKRFGKPEEVANLCLYLSSDLAGYITASEINISGGLC
jgi:3-oxoacyl-[acyl-carrier protein] reductase